MSTTDDKTRLIELRNALNAVTSALRRGPEGQWVLHGHPGCHIAAWPDGPGWQLVVRPEKELSKQAWTWTKKRLAFCKITEDYGQEGSFRLLYLPTPAEAAEIRRVLGIRKRSELSPEELARRQEVGRRLAAKPPK